MTWIKSMIIAFSMYSKVPMPRVEWNEKNMKYSLVFFPFIGAVIGGILMCWWELSNYLSIRPVFRSAIGAVIPLLLTGGIHFDGFIDTVDALHSYQTREKKLEILKDPHIGAFAIIGSGVYFLLYFGGLTEVSLRKLWILLSLGFILSRALSGLSLVLFQSAKKEGLLYAFSSAAHRKVTGMLLILIILLCSFLMVMLRPLTGGAAVISAVIVFGYYRHMSYQEFGGITGDLAGFFLQVCELVMLLVISVSGRF